MLPSMTRPFELVDNLIFDGLLVIAQARGLSTKNGETSRLLSFG